MGVRQRGESGRPQAGAPGNWEEVVLEHGQAASRTALARTRASLDTRVKKSSGQAGSRD